MRSLPVLAFALSSLSLIACGSDERGSPPAIGHVQSPIVRGGTASAYSAAVLVLVDGLEATATSKSFLCTGVVVSPHVVLTAAHCVHPDFVKGQITAVFTGNNVNDPKEFANRDLFRFQKEAHYDPAWSVAATEAKESVISLGHDLGAIVVDEAFDVTPAPVLRVPLTERAIGTPMRVVGYGLRKADGGNSAVGRRMQTELTLSGLNDASLWFETTESSPSVCHGDSGGPTLAVVDDKEVVVGVHAWVEHTKTCTGTNVDARIDRFVEAFLDPIIANADPSFVMEGPVAPRASEAADASATPAAAASSAAKNDGCSVGASPNAPSSAALAVLALLGARRSMRSRRRRRDS